MILLEALIYNVDAKSETMAEARWKAAASITRRKCPVRAGITSRSEILVRSWKNGYGKDSKKKRASWGKVKKKLGFLGGGLRETLELRSDPWPLPRHISHFYPLPCCLRSTGGLGRLSSRLVGAAPRKAAKQLTCCLPAAHETCHLFPDLPSNKQHHTLHCTTTIRRTCVHVLDRLATTEASQLEKLHRLKKES